MARSEEDIEWEKSEGIPQVEDPFIQKYLNGREALIEQEHKQRHGQILHNSIFPSYYVSSSGMISIQQSH
jgi:adenosine deaminase CECR1